MIQQFHSWVYRRRIEGRLSRDVCILTFLAAVVTIAKNGSNSNAHQLMNGKIKCGIYYNGILFRKKKKE